jgi:hypothetical protein
MKKKDTDASGIQDGGNRSSGTIRDIGSSRNHGIRRKLAISCRVRFPNSDYISTSSLKTFLIYIHFLTLTLALTFTLTHQSRTLLPLGTSGVEIVPMLKQNLFVGIFFYTFNNFLYESPCITVLLSFFVLISLSILFRSLYYFALYVLPRSPPPTV